MKYKDYYAILGLQKTASADEIKTAVARPENPSAVPRTFQCVAIVGGSCG